MGLDQGASSVHHGDCLLLMGSLQGETADHARLQISGGIADRFGFRLTGNLLRCVVPQQVGRTKRKQVLLTFCHYPPGHPVVKKGRHLTWNLAMKPLP